MKYQVSFDIPSNKNEWVKGHVAIYFDYLPSEKDIPLLIDFQGHAVSPSCLVNGKQTPVEWKDEHILIPRSLLEKGKNAIQLDFESDHTPLNRHEDYLYTLFVPDHAHAAMPCFDQPDLKACFSLQLKLPASWKAISSGSIIKDSVISASNSDVPSYKILQFSETRPLPTYLFSFTAGQFQEKTAVRDGRQLSCLYRETDPEKVAQLDEVMDEIALSLRWMEAYTGIPYPFEKYGFVMIPSYQFGSMEHPGAIQYNDRTVFLGKNPTLDDRLHRLELLAHETAHMWFGDCPNEQKISKTMQKRNEIRTQISNHLQEIEEQYHVKILFAVESGSRAWGFASKDSDWDVRFIYVHEPEWYYHIEEQKGTIEMMFPDEVDASGWDLKKALRLFKRSNPSFFEWIHSPIIYEQDETFIDEIKKMEDEYFDSDKAMFYHRATKWDSAESVCNL